MKAIYIFVCFSVILLLSSCGGARQATTKAKEPDLVTLNSGLKYQELLNGSGKSPQFGNTVSIHMILKSEDGTVIENSYLTSQAISFKIGNGEVIPGLEEGVLGMKKGGKRRLIIPSDLGFGSRSVRSLQANTNLICEVELLKID